jgi:hypothetical protein
MVTAPFESRPIIDIVRSDPSLVTALADSGITPRYLYWTVEAAARDLDLNLNQLVRRLTASANDHASRPAAVEITP